jgi:hypothetical protein
MTVCILLKNMQIPFPGSVLRKPEVHKNEQKNDHPLLLTCALVPAVAMAFGNQTTRTRAGAREYQSLLSTGKSIATVSDL